ncbi:MAG: hypothetical protein KGD58_16740 [Candidatus Lokiarchaeota archaeon]|nr:hypothetical protein [Candidatus Lokiarchaeota archaeon]
MTDFALMFNARPGGEIFPVKWGKDNFVPDTSIIVLDEGSESIYLWHGVQQGLVARRTALRQAESLKGHGYTVGKSIIGRDLKSLKEIDARKVGKVPEDTQMNEEMQGLLDRKRTELDNFIVTFQEGAVKPVSLAPKVKEAPKVETKPVPKPVAAKPSPAPVTPKPTPTQIKSTDTASEYNDTGPLPSIKTDPTPVPTALVSKTNLTTNAKISFVFSAILEHFDDIWISKKKDGSYSVEEMDGPICSFSLMEGSKINFSSQSFSRVDPKVKTAIQKKFIELSKLI